MKPSQLISLAFSGVRAMINPDRPPVLATIILTDRCNLNCRHCAVANERDTYYSFAETVELMSKLRSEGVKILFFCGGEAFLWQDGRYTIHGLVSTARKMGFLLICVVTNGTISADVPGADLVFLSIDGMEQNHNLIRGNTFRSIMSNLERVTRPNIVFYMAVNRINIDDIENVAFLAADRKMVKAVSFNFHTPYKGTEGLVLDKGDKEKAVTAIKALMESGAPVFNLPVGLEHYLNDRWERPCSQCVVYEDGRAFSCGRCSEIPGLCRECGYLFAVEFGLLLQGNLRAIREMLKVYLKYA